MKLKFLKLNILLVSAITLFSASCKDDMKLGKAEDTFVTISPSNTNIVYGVDTIEMQCIVQNKSGNKVDTDLKWTSMDESVVHFVNGTNKLTATKGSQGKHTFVRVTLPNGKYAETIVSVINVKANAISLFHKVFNGYTNITQDVKDNETLFAGVGTPKEIMVVVSPADMLLQDDFEFEKHENITIEPLILDPNKEEDKAKIQETPKGGKWFKLIGKQEGVFDINVSIGKQAENNKAASRFTKKMKINFGPVVASMGVNKERNQYEGSHFVDVNTQDTVFFNAEINPSDQVSVEKVFNTLKWETEGTGAIIKSKGFKIVDGVARFYAVFLSGANKGQFTISCQAQDKFNRYTVNIVDIKNLPFESVQFNPEQLTEPIMVGESRPIRIAVVPTSSYGYLQKEFQFSYSNPEIAEVVKDETGLYAIKGKKSGATDITVSLRGKSATLHVETKPAPKALEIKSLDLINNLNLRTVMLGDVVQWQGNVVLYGDDQPNYKDLVWTVNDKSQSKIVSISKKGNTEFVNITAKEIPDGQKDATVRIKADYRGTSNISDLKIVPLQSDVNILASDLDLDNAGITKENGFIKIPLDLKQGINKSLISILIRPNSGNINNYQGTFTPSDCKIYILWNNIALYRLANEGQVAITANGNKYNLNATLRLIVGKNTINVSVVGENLESF